MEIRPYRQIAQEDPNSESKFAVQREAGESCYGTVARECYIELSSSGAGRFGSQALQLSKAHAEVLRRNSTEDGQKMPALGDLPHNAIIWKSAVHYQEGAW